MNGNIKGVSVIICCFNSADKIEKTLSYLASQIKQEGIQYEIILVDNNCTDATVQKALACWEFLGKPFPLYVTVQSVSGLTYARQKGIAAANYEYLILCDDDNWLSDNYLQKVYAIFETIPNVALAGGVGEAVFENEKFTPPEWFQKIQGFGYAVGDEGRKTGYTCAVYGAGMCIRKSVFEKLIGDKLSFILSVRNGKFLSSGGDTEICIIIEKAGYKIFFDTSLRFKHFITADRLQWGYYLQLRRSFGIATAYLQAYSSNSVVNTPSTVRFAKQAIQYWFLITRHIHFFLFPFFFKTASCASFVQQLSLKKTMLLKKNKIETLAEKINQLFNHL